MESPRSQECPLGCHKIKSRLADRQRLTEYCGCLRAGKFLPLAELQIRQIAFKVEVPSLQFPLGDTIERLSSVHH